MKTARIELTYAGRDDYFVTRLTNCLTFSTPGPRGSRNTIGSKLTSSEVELLAISPNFDVTIILER